MTSASSMTSSDLAFLKKKPRLAAKLAGLNDDDVLEAIGREKLGTAAERPVKQVELDAVLAVPEGFGDDVPIDPNFHARRLPDAIWRQSAISDGIAAVIQLHRLREVLALTGFTRFEAVTPDIDGEYESDVERADLADDPKWFPAVENRGEGIFVLLDSAAVKAWLGRPDVKGRLDELVQGHAEWTSSPQHATAVSWRPLRAAAHFSHLLLQSLAMRCGYPASSIRERVYVDPAADRYGLMLYTASPDAEGTLGGLVGQARDIEAHLAVALRAGGLCSNDPVCAQHSPGEGFEGRWLTRRRLSRLRADRRDILRDAQRLPRSRTRRSDARGSGCGVLPQRSSDPAAARSPVAPTPAAGPRLGNRPARHPVLGDGRAQCTRWRRGGQRHP